MDFSKLTTNCNFKVCDVLSSSQKTALQTMGFEQTSEFNQTFRKLYHVIGAERCNFELIINPYVNEKDLPSHICINYFNDDYDEYDCEIDDVIDINEILSDILKLIQLNILVIK